MRNQNGSHWKLQQTTFDASSALSMLVDVVAMCVFVVAVALFTYWIVG